MNVYLTFDDGPQNPGTKNCLDTLAHFSIPATFFVIGEHLLRLGKNNSSLNDQIYSNHLLANHSFSHAREIGYTNYYSLAGYASNDIVRCHDFFSFTTTLVRLPGNSAWVNQYTIASRKQVMQSCSELQQLGFFVAGWDLEWECVNNEGSLPSISHKQLYEQILKMGNSRSCRYPGHIVVLMHDRMFSSPKRKHALRDLLTLLLNHRDIYFKVMSCHPLYKKS